MLDIKLIEQKIELETELKDAKLWLAQKEVVEYNNFKEANPQIPGAEPCGRIQLIV